MTSSSAVFQSESILVLWFEYLDINGLNYCSSVSKLFNHIIVHKIHHIWKYNYYLLNEISMSPKLHSASHTLSPSSFSSITNHVNNKYYKQYSHSFYSKFLCSSNPFGVQESVDVHYVNPTPRAGLVSALFDLQNSSSKLLMHFGGATTNYKFLNTVSACEIKLIDNKTPVAVIPTFPITIDYCSWQPFGLTARWLHSGCMTRNNRFYVTGGQYPHPYEHNEVDDFLLFTCQESFNNDNTSNISISSNNNKSKVNSNSSCINSSHSNNNSHDNCNNITSNSNNNSNTNTNINSKVKKVTSVKILCQTLDSLCVTRLPLSAGHSMVYDEVRHRLVVFGGLTPEGQALSDFYYLDLPPDHSETTELVPVKHMNTPNSDVKKYQYTWVKVSAVSGSDSDSAAGPSRRYCHSAQVVHRQMIVFGGWLYPGTTVYNDLHSLCLDSLVWTRVEVLGGVPPAPRCQAVCYIMTSTACQRLVSTVTATAAASAGGGYSIRSSDKQSVDSSSSADSGTTKYDTDSIVSNNSNSNNTNNKLHLPSASFTQSVPAATAYTEPSKPLPKLNHLTNPDSRNHLIGKFLIIFGDACQDHELALQANEAYGNIVVDFDTFLVFDLYHSVWLKLPQSVCHFPAGRGGVNSIVHFSHNATANSISSNSNSSTRENSNSNSNSGISGGTSASAISEKSNAHSSDERYTDDAASADVIYNDSSSNTSGDDNTTDVLIPSSSPSSSCSGGISANEQPSYYIMCGGMHSDADSDMPTFRNDLIFLDAHF